jgi:hypothetical protein
MRHGAKVKVKLCSSSSEGCTNQARRGGANPMCSNTDKKEMQYGSDGCAKHTLTYSTS